MSNKITALKSSEIPIQFEPLICVAVVLLCLVPFVAKPFHIDDPLFVWAAKHIQSHPHDFYGFTVNWNSFNEPMSEVTQNPPLACYYIAAVGLIFGFSEVALHIAFLIPAVATALGCYYLARQFCSKPLPAALTAVVTPGFMISATNVMCDIIMLAFWVWAMHFWMKGIISKKSSLLFVSAVLASFCALSKYYGIALIILLAAYTIIQNHRIGGCLFYLLIPVAVIAGYQWIAHILYGKSLLGEAALFATVTRNQNWLGDKGLLVMPLTALSFAGGCALSILFFAPLLWSLRTIITILVISVLLPLTIYVSASQQSLFWQIQLTLMVAGGVSILLLAIADFSRKREPESILLLFWVFGTFIFTGFINWAVNARSILPMMPAVGILLIRRLEQSPEYQSRNFWRLAWPLAPTAIVAIAVCLADYTLAVSARDAAAAICRSYQDRIKNTYFVGHWGFQYYMQQAGARPIDLKNPVFLRGDIVVCPMSNTNRIELRSEVAQRDAVMQFNIFSWIATMNRRCGAGFYHNAWGPMPFVFVKTEPEVYIVSFIK